jgi:phosphoribosylanthranilate isomerase
MPSGPGVISEELIARIAGSVPPPIGTFLLTSNQDPAEIIRQQHRCGVNTIQLCDHLPANGHRKLRRSLPGISLVQVVHVAGDHGIDEALEVAPHVDALLLDSGNQALTVKELGGTGRTHDWDVSARIVSRVPVPVFLAGGLNAENVRSAIETVRPFGVDLCSGIRTNGMLDERKLQEFMAAVAAAERTT